MKLQGAVFDFEGSLLDAEGRPLPGLEEFLSLMKIEDVWMFLATDGDRRTAQQVLEQTGLATYFRGIVAAPEYGLAAGDPALYQKALRRLRTAPRATVAFTAREELLRALHDTGFQTVLVGQGPDSPLAPLTVERISDYREMTRSLTL